MCRIIGQQLSQSGVMSYLSAYHLKGRAITKLHSFQEEGKGAAKFIHLVLKNKDFNGLQTLRTHFCFIII